MREETSGSETACPGGGGWGGILRKQLDGLACTSQAPGGEGGEGYPSSVTDSTKYFNSHPRNTGGGEGGGD
jgi:hypothetical protein